MMPTYQGQLKNEEIAALIAYIKSLSEEMPNTEEPMNDRKRFHTRIGFRSCRLSGATT